MLRGIHTIRSGFSTSHNPTVPRQYNLDNGNYEVNMRILSIDIMAGIDPGQLDMGNHRIMFVLATDAAGATPTALTGPSEEEEAYQFRFNDDRQIGWGTISANYGTELILDPGHIIPEDLYINAWQLGTGGSPELLECPISFIITMASTKNTGAEALLYQVKNIN